MAFDTRSRGRPLLLGLLALLHAAGLLFLQHLLATPRPAAVHTRQSTLVAVRLLKAQTAAPKPAQREISAPPVDRQNHLPTQESPGAPAIAVQTTEAPAPSPIAGPAASIAPPTARLLDSAATRHALREAARAPLLSERAASAMGDEPVNAQQKLAQSVQQAGHGDCVKGEYLGGGLGLLSTPFFLLAELRGQCSK
ncbi:hypothetical protein [Roseateles koreensis]|uniref:Transmembrane protein n=1 Tax=Roseateles koreensis TaxID=2987526 RepID=A0ABT5KL10_9BURK|nr:hypothetical protein [Roseateles koreensis]MDC8783599.1 hypothetical protein [Roseateles koreensis]